MPSQYVSGGDTTAVDPTWSDIYNLSTQQNQTPTQPRVPQTYDQSTAMPTWNTNATSPYVQQPQASRQGQAYQSAPNLQATSTQPQPMDDSVLGFIRSMPTKEEDRTRHGLWAELVRLKTRALELQIADAKAKEKEAEAELFKLKMMYRDKGGDIDMSLPVQTTQQDVFGGLPMSNQGSGEYIQGQQNQSQGFYGQPAGNALDLGMSGNYGNTVIPPTQSSGIQSDQLPTSMTTFDLEAMMQHNNLDNMFSWLPDFGDTSRSTFPVTAQSQGVDPSALFNINSTEPQRQYHDQILATPMSVKPNITSPINRRSRTPDEDEPASKKTKRPEKKTVVEHMSECTICAKPLARIMLRAPRTSIPDLISIEYACPECRAVSQPPALSDMYGGGSGGSGIGTVDSRKRLRIAMEAVDEDKAEVEGRRAFCDVCQRVFASGMAFGGHTRENLGSILEVVCTGCDSKYSRCTDVGPSTDARDNTNNKCGGGGGGRVGIGKWRMKQVFQPGRKTCSLSHTRLGDRPREIGVHVTPTDFTAEELKEVLARCKQLWNEKTLARLAVPEMLEIDLPAHLTNPIRNYADVEDIVTQNWPNRESMIRAEGADPLRFKRLLGLVWAHSKSRRGTRTVDIEEEWQKSGEGDADDMSTVLDNVKRTNLAIPGGSELIGMWGGEWDMKHGSLLVSTFIPFEGTDGEDSTALSVGEMITKVQMMRQSMNQQRKEAALAKGVEADLVRQCEHLWVVSGGAMPLVRERIADILIRKRSFVHVDEYLTRHPDFANALSARPVGLHPDVLRPSPSSPETKPPPLVLVRWLGKDFDADKILEIKQAEFGGKANKLKKKSKVK